MFKTKISLLLLFIGVMTISCKKNNDPSPENIIGNPNGAKKLLIKLDSGNGNVYEVTYDENSRVIMEKEGSFKANFTYNNEGKLESARSIDGTTSVRNEFEWSVDGKTLTTLKYINDLLEMKFIQELNANGEPIKTTEFKPDANDWVEKGYTVYNWTNGNLMSFEYWAYVTDSQEEIESQHLYTCSYEYDTKINPFRHLSTITTNGNYTMFRASINNCTVLKYYSVDIDIEDTFDGYEYSDDDYPISYKIKESVNQQVNVSTVTFEYQ